MKNTIVKPALISLGGVIMFTAGYVLIAEATLRWLDDRYSALEDWNDDD